MNHTIIFFSGNTCKTNVGHVLDKTTQPAKFGQNAWCHDQLNHIVKGISCQDHLLFTKKGRKTKKRMEMRDNILLQLRVHCAERHLHFLFDYYLVFSAFLL